MLTHLRPADAADCEAIYEAHSMAVRYTCARSYDSKILEAWNALLSEESYLETIESDDKVLWVIEYKGKIQGFFQLNLREALLDALYVHPFLHNQGLGTALINRAEELAVKANLSILSLYASENSIPFYRLNGYESLGEALMPLNAQVSVKCQLMRKFL